jgi:hypothetical protein
MEKCARASNEVTEIDVRMTIKTCTWTQTSMNYFKRSLTNIGIVEGTMTNIVRLPLTTTIVTANRTSIRIGA